MSDYHLHNEIMRAIGRLEGKVDGINGRLDTANGRLKSHDDKIGNLETDMASIKAKATVLGGIAGITLSMIWNYVKNKLIR